MGSEDIQSLANELGLNEARAEKLLELADGSVQQARNLFKLKLFAVKGHIISEDRKIYGSIMIIINEKTNSRKINNLNVLLSQDKTVLSIPPESSYNHYYKNFIDLSFKIQPLTNMMNEINNLIFQNIEGLNSSDLYDTENSINYNIIFETIKNAVYSVIRDNYFTLNINIEPLSFVDFNIPESFNKESSEKKSGKDYQTESDKKKVEDIVYIKCDFLLSPTKGVAANNLKIGDILYVKIMDDKPEAKKIADFLRQKYDGQLPNLRVPIIKIEESESERLAIYVQLTEKMQGILMINKEIKVEVFDPNANNTGINSKDSSKYLLYAFIIIFGLLILYLLLKSF